MPIDPSIPLAVQNNQVDLGAIVSKGLQLKQLQQQMQTENALKQVLAEPDAVDPKTGQPTANALAKITRISPQLGTKLTGEIASTQERQAQTEHAQSETQAARQKAYRDDLSEQLGVYDEAVKSGNVDPKDAERTLKDSLRDRLYKDASLSPEKRDQNWAMIEKMNPIQLRALTMTAEQKAAHEEELRKETSERTLATMGGKPVLVDKQGNVYDPNTKQPLKVEGPVEREATGLDPQRAAMDQRRLALQEKLAAGSAADLTEDDLKFAGALVANGQPMPNMGYGAAGAKARAKILHYAAQQASSEAGGSPEAGAADVVARKSELHADQQSLNVAKKQQQSVRQFSQTALGLADKVDGLMDRVAAKGPEAWAKFVQNVKLKALADTDTKEFLGYVTDLQSENAKIMAGATGSVAQVSAHNQEMMNHMLSGDQPVSEIKGSLRAIREGIRMRNESVADEVKRQSAQLRGDTAGGGAKAAEAISSEMAHPKSRADYDALPSGAHYAKPGDAPGTYRVKP